MTLLEKPGGCHLENGRVLVVLRIVGACHLVLIALKHLDKTHLLAFIKKTDFVHL